jgi:hypothetical protein
VILYVVQYYQGFTKLSWKDRYLAMFTTLQEESIQIFSDVFIVAWSGTA